MANENVINLVGKLRDAYVNAEPNQATLQSGGGGGTFDGMEARVKALEDDTKKILQDTAEIKGMLRSAPSAVDFGELKGRVNSLPTTAKAATLLSIAVAAVAIINNWSAIKAAIF
ncbi:hypothetical protein [Rhizobium sp. BR 362]|uniref:hypothetical protein n=1 Tax=Rhizobium sp. BR 362 TaxID=3040670 RepID=UPI002F3E2653